MAQTKIKVIDKWFGGIVRDEKSKIVGSASNIEELDIFANEDFIQTEQIMSVDTLPADTEIYDYTADNDDTVWGYGANTAGSSEVRLVKVTTGGVDNPGAIATQFTSADTTDIAYEPAPIQYFRRDDGNQDFLYYITNASGTVKLKSYDITAGTETEQGTGATNMTLTGLTGSYDRMFTKVGFGELYVGNGQFIAKVDKDGVFTEKAFTLPNGWEAVDMEFVSDVGLILARNVNRLINESRGFWWDLTESVQVDDSFEVPMGGPQWVINFRERITMCFAQNGDLRFFGLPTANPGSQVVPIPGIRLSNVAADTSTRPISAPKMVSTKEDVLYFGVNKTDKTGIYALGQLEAQKPLALVLSKRFHTTDYSNHVPHSLFIQGPNFYAAFDDNGTNRAMRCETNNSPDRSDNAVYESVWIDDRKPFSDKNLQNVYITTHPLDTNAQIVLSVDSDYSGSYTTLTRPDGSNFDTNSGLLGFYKAPGFSNKKVLKVKLEFTSDGANPVKVTSIGLNMEVMEHGAPQ